MKGGVRTFLLWAIALVITLSSAVYQRLTGPTWEYSGTTGLAGRELNFRLDRTFDGEGDQPVVLTVPTGEIAGTLLWRRHDTGEQWREIPLVREADELQGALPHQPPAGKLDYRIILTAGDETVTVPADGYVTTRFKGAVPPTVLLIHVLLMFTAMLFSTRTGIEALLRRGNVKRLTIWTFAILVAGGMIFGPIMQHYAFGELWTGIPLGWDLTDNKTLISVIVWAWALRAVLTNRPARTPVLAASILTLVIYLIPHSLLGSELDYTQEP